MNADIKREWMKRLRSGDISQLTDHLGDIEGGRCCLGVLCDIAVEKGIILEPTLNEDAKHLTYAHCFVRCVPPVVSIWAEMSDPHGIGSYSSGQANLANDNDTGQTFLQIADIIEEYF